MSPESLWEHCLTALESELPAQQFTTWIRPLRVDAQVTDALCLIAPNRFVLDWVNNHYLAHIETLAREAQPHASHCLSTRLVAAAPAGRRPARSARRIAPRRGAASPDFGNDYKSAPLATLPPSRVPSEPMSDTPPPSSPLSQPPLSQSPIQPPPLSQPSQQPASSPAKKRKPAPETAKRRTPPTSALEILSGERGVAPKQTQLALGDELSLDTPETEDLGQGMPFEQLPSAASSSLSSSVPSPMDPPPALNQKRSQDTPLSPSTPAVTKTTTKPTSKAPHSAREEDSVAPSALSKSAVKPSVKKATEGDTRPAVPTLPSGAEKTAKKAATTGRKAAIEGGLKHHANLNTEFTFQSFVEGKSNQLGLAAAQQVAENPGHSYNPLYIYGGVGLGKTHLMHAVGNALREKNANAKIVYLHSERFVADMVKALQLNAINDFKRYYRSVDALLIDDIQFFSGKERSQEEFFHTFNALLEGGQQVILTGDRYPREMQNVEERLKSRFGWGLTVAVEPPELETRVAILMKKAEMEKIHLPDDAAFFIAHRVRSNVRELEGTLKRVIANARFVNRPIDIGLVRDALKDLLALQDKLVGIDNIQRVVAEYYKIKVADLHSKRRTRQIARPRQIAMSLAKELTSQSLPEIGNAFGGRDHTTVLHACRKVRELERDDVDICEDIKNLMRLLTD